MKKIRFLAVMLCMAALMCSFAVTVNAQSNEPTIEQAPAVTPAPVPAPPHILALEMMNPDIIILSLRPSDYR